MKLEQEIKQKQFETPYQKAMLNIIFTNSWVSNIQLHYFKQYDISPQQYNVLRILRGQFPEPASVNLIIERMLDKMSNASRLVEKLRQKELVERKECLHDRRQVDVVITEKGLELLKEIDGNFSEMMDKFSGLTPEEAGKLSDLLDKMRG